MKANFWKKYKAFIIFIVVFAIAFFGTRALLSKPKNSQVKTTAPLETISDTTNIKTTK